MRENSLIDDASRPTLESLDTSAGWSAGGEYSHFLAQHAVFLMIYDLGVTVPDLLRFYELTGEGMSWEEAFLESYGVTIEDFYTFFENQSD